MNEVQLVELVRQAALTGMVVAAPLLVAAFVVATLAGLVQSATGIHEPIVGIVPRLAVMAGVLLAALPWMVESLAELVRAAAAGS